MPVMKKLVEDGGISNRTKRTTKAILKQKAADHELFLQVFEKPTQIYRFLSIRSKLSPLFLRRNLSYTPRHRLSHNRNFHRDFNINKMLGKVMVENLNSNPMLDTSKSDYMTIAITGYYGKTECAKRVAKVRVAMLEVSDSKRDDAITLNVVHSEVQINPSEIDPPSKVPVVSVPMTVELSKATPVKSYLLHFQVNCLFVDSTTGELDVKEVEAELEIFDKDGCCHLLAGDYELPLETALQSKKDSLTSQTIWHSAGSDGINLKGWPAKSVLPVLKFRLGWSKEPKFGLEPFPHKLLPSLPSAAPATLCGDPETPGSSAAVRKIEYHLIYHGSKQQTEVYNDLSCPWCSLQCGYLYILLKHLRLCHPRFSFTYNEIVGGAMIMVSLNTQYDGSYSGNPRDLVAQPPGCSFARDGPEWRSSFTEVIVAHPHHPPPSLSEFRQSQCYDTETTNITGHNRIYYDEMSRLPLWRCELENDTSLDSSLPWQQTITINTIEEFTDLNKGEKDIFKMWNLFMLEHKCLAEKQMPQACQLFIETYGIEIVQNNLYRNFILHLCCLHDFEILSSMDVFKATKTLQKMCGIKEKRTSQDCGSVSKKQKTQDANIMSSEKTWHSQFENWLSGRES